MISYTLMHGDTRLGVLTRYDLDFPWEYCHFTADPAFACIQTIFEESLRLLNSGDRVAWIQAYDKIVALDLYLVNHKGLRGKTSRIHIHTHDNIARFRMPRCWEAPQ